MGHPDPADVPPDEHVAELAHVWLRGVVSAGFVPGPRARARQVLEELLRQTIAALRAEPFDPRAGERVGAQLVQRRMMAPDVLGITIALLGEHLPALAAADDRGDADRRVTSLLGCLATGFVTAQRDAAVAAAEQISRSYRIHSHARLTRLQEQLRHSLLHDPRTGLRNRAGLREHLAAMARRPGSRIGVCLLSIDRFAEINDALGHEHGDTMLNALADRLRELADRNGYVAAHLADDQFALALTGTVSVDEVVKAAEQAARLLRAAIDVNGHDLRLTCTAGVVEGPAAETQPDAWLRNAHLALRGAREDHREIAEFDPVRSARALRRQRLTAAMPTALERGEFVAYFQPLYRLANRRITGVEALARWHHPTAGPLGPQYFIGPAEQTGLIHALGHTLLQQACTLGATWQNQHPGLLISVNLSPMQLSDPRLVADIDATLRSTGLPADSLQLEITESAAVDDHHDVLHRLAGLGVRLAIDDFGTGYSTFASLPDLPFSAIKLAAELLPRQHTDDARREILQSLIRLGDTLAINVTAEGIESQADELLLTELGCTHGQGYHFSPPVESHTLAAMLGARR